MSVSVSVSEKVVQFPTSLIRIGECGQIRQLICVKRNWEALCKYTEHRPPLSLTLCLCVCEC